MSNLYQRPSEYLIQQLSSVLLTQVTHSHAAEQVAGSFHKRPPSVTANPHHCLLLWVISPHSLLVIVSSESNAMHGNCMLYMSLSYLALFLYSPYDLLFTFTVLGWSLRLLGLSHPADRGCYCVVAVTPQIKSTLASPTGSQKNTWER